MSKSKTKEYSSDVRNKAVELKNRAKALQIPISSSGQYLRSSNQLKVCYKSVWSLIVCLQQQQ